MTHSPEPWTVESYQDWHSLMDATGNDIHYPEGKYEDSGMTMDLEDAERIVACVNACAGIPNSVLNDPHQCLLSMADFAVAELMQSMEYEGNDKDYLRFLYMVRGCIKNMAEKTKPTPILCVNCATVIRKADAIRWEEWKATHPERLP